MAFTTTQLAALEAAIASGELVVQHDGKRVEYRSVGDLVKARDLVRAELVASGLLATPTRGGSTVASYSSD
jgi:roadblock/LC7 domain-containing protein